MSKRSSILIIYTGGTIGMIKDPKTGALSPFNFDHLLKHIPVIDQLDYDIKSYSFEEVIDSSCMTPSAWVKMVDVIEENYEKFDGFVILHGSDTMAYTASALSFMLDNIDKPVILTGSQLPIGLTRTDARENLIAALEVATAKKDGKPIISEVCILFEDHLYRGNRTSKFNAENFDAFLSPNYPELADIGIEIKYNYKAVLPRSTTQFEAHKNLDPNIAVLKLFPGITPKVVEAILNIEGLKAVIIQTYGSGNAPTENWFLDLLKKATEKGIIIFNVTQCVKGSVNQGKYETSLQLEELGVVSGKDITLEAAIAKLMFLLGQNLSKPTMKKMLNSSLKGEISI